MAKGALHAIGLGALLCATAAWAQDVPAPTVSPPGATPIDVPPSETAAPPPAETPTAEVPTAAPAPEPEPVADLAPAAGATPSDTAAPTVAEAVDHAAPEDADHTATEGADHVAPGGTAPGAIGGGSHHAHSPPTVYNRILVDGADDLTFYYIRQDLFLALGVTDAARYSEIQTSGYYGPYATGTEIQVRAAAPYLVIPICDGQPLGAHQRIVQSNFGTAIIRKLIACH